MERGFYHPSRGYWQTTGEVPDEILSGYPEGTVEIPVKPSNGFEWNGSEWAATLPAKSPEELLNEARAGAILTKGAFCTALMRTGILSATEAIMAAKGEWPPTFADFTAAMPETVAAEAQIKWAAAIEVHYSDPLLQLLALNVAGGNAAAATLLDGLFGLEVLP